MPADDFYLKCCVMETNANKFSGLRLKSRRAIFGDFSEGSSNLTCRFFVPMSLHNIQPRSPAIPLFSVTLSFASAENSAYHVSRKSEKNLITIFCFEEPYQGKQQQQRLRPQKNFFYARKILI